MSQGRYLCDKMSIDKDDLTELQRKFVDALLSDPDMSPQEAYVQAGYAENGACSAAYTLLRNVKISRVLDKEMAKRAVRTRITKDRVLREIASMAFSNVDDYEVDEDGEITLKDGANHRAMKAVQSVEHDISYDKEGNKRVKTRLRLWDKGKAVDQLSKHLNLFSEHQEAGATKITQLTDAELAERLELAAKTLKGEK